MKLFTFRKVSSPFLFYPAPPFLNKAGFWLMSASSSPIYVIFTSSLRKTGTGRKFPERNQSISDLEAAVVSNCWAPRVVSGLTRSLARSQWTHGPGCSPTGTAPQNVRPRHSLRSWGTPRTCNTRNWRHLAAQDSGFLSSLWWGKSPGTCCCSSSFVYDYYYYYNNSLFFVNNSFWYAATFTFCCIF